ncbi:hypothetical protein AB0H28_21945 [Micromonospora sp. NPDC050980]|uniref:hypothetical protein n=1 Tax=Micromonospora sp. NPDC050980 TaxID=3155161 RepID=UPI0033F55CD7
MRTIPRSARQRRTSRLLTLLLAAVLGAVGTATPAVAGPNTLTMTRTTNQTLQFGGANNAYSTGCYRVDLTGQGNQSLIGTNTFWIPANYFIAGNRGLGLRFTYQSAYGWVSLNTDGGGVLLPNGSTPSGGLARLAVGSIVTITRVTSLPYTGQGFTCTLPPPAGERCRSFTITGRYGQVTMAQLLGTGNDSRVVVAALAYAQLKGRYCWNGNQVTRQRIEPIQHDFTSSPVPAGLFFERKNPRTGSIYLDSNRGFYRVTQSGVDIYVDVPAGVRIYGVPIPQMSDRYVGKINFDTRLNAGGTVEATSGAEVWTSAIGTGL